MNVQAYYNNNLKVFEGITTTLLDTSELAMLDIIFLQKYKYNVMDAEEQSTVKILASNVLFKNHNYYEAIKKSYETEFDALATTDIKEINENQTATTKLGTEELLNVSSTIRSDSGSNKTTGGTINTRTTKTIGTDSDNMVSVVNTKEGSIMERVKTDAELKGSDKTTTKNINGHTASNPDTKTTTTISKPTYDNSNPVITEINSVSTEDNKIMEVESVPGSIKREDNYKVTSYGSKLSESGSHVSDAYEESIDTVNKVNIEDKTVSTNDNLTVTSTNNGSNTNNSNLDKSINENTSLTESINISMKGHLNANFLKLINDIHESRKINLYDIILSDVFDVICLSMYDFDTI